MLELRRALESFGEARRHDEAEKKAVREHLLLHATRSFACTPKSLRATARIDEAEFAAAHVDAWSSMLTHLAAWQGSQSRLRLPRLDRVLVVCWQFPELPLLLSQAKDEHILVVVANDAPWLEPLRRAGCTVNLRTKGSTDVIVEQMRAGRVVAAMLDHVATGTRKTKLAPFLGHQIPVASGLLEQSVAHDYTLAFIGPRGAGVEVLHTLAARGQRVEELAAWVARCLEAEVKRAPARWLMWPAVAGMEKA